MSRKQRRTGKRKSGDKVPEAGDRAKARVAKGRAGATPAVGRHPLDNWLLGLALAGIVLTAYLTFVAWSGEHPAYCGAESDCGLVQQSRWSTLLGIPIALWGLFTYALLARLVWRLRTRPSSWRMALTIAIVGAAVSWYLTSVSVFVIEAVCVYCLASFGLINALLVLLLVRRPTHMPEHEWAKSLPGPLGSAVVVVFALFLNFSGLFDPAAGPEKPYLKALAIHLHDSGARFYGAYWCPACQEQKALFEASVDRLPYVECSPNGRRGARNFACTANDINDFPTWILDGRRLTGVISVGELAAMSGFAWSDDGARKQ